jgi:carnitine 3-dehydrogenase
VAFDKPIRRIAIVATGVIGVSWADEFLANGFDVIAAGPATTAEANLRKYVDTTWTSLTALGLAKDASQQRLRFTQHPKKALGELKEGRPCLAVSHVS